MRTEEEINKEILKLQEELNVVKTFKEQDNQFTPLENISNGDKIKFFDKLYKHTRKILEERIEEKSIEDSDYEYYIYELASDCVCINNEKNFNTWFNKHFQ